MGMKRLDKRSAYIRQIRQIRVYPRLSASHSFSLSWRFPVGRSVAEEAVPRAGDEDVFEGRLAEGDRLDVGREGFDQSGDPLVSVGLLQAEGAVDDFGFALEALADAGGEFRGAFGLDRDGVAAERGAESLRRIERDKPPLVHDRDAVGSIGFVEQVSRQDDRRSLALADLPKVLPEVAAGARVEAGARFVE